MLTLEADFIACHPEVLYVQYTQSAFGPEQTCKQASNESVTTTTHQWVWPTAHSSAATTNGLQSVVNMTVAKTCHTLLAWKYNSNCVSALQQAKSVNVHTAVCLADQRQLTCMRS